MAPAGKEKRENENPMVGGVSASYQNAAAGVTDLSPEAIAAAGGLTESVSITVEDAMEKLGYGPFQILVMTATGLCFMADAMETLLLTILSVVLKSKWGLSNTETAFLTSSVFLGAMIGTLVLGPVGDRIGRRPGFLLSALFIAIFGAATAFCNTYAALVVTRSLVGFGIGGVTVPFDTFAEVLPTSMRGRNLLYIEYYWTSGTLLVVLFAYFTLNSSSVGDDENAWRYFVLLCSLPCVLSAVMALLLVPESPRWLCSQGRKDEAMAIIKRAAKINGLPEHLLFPPNVTLAEELPEDGSCLDLFSPRWRWITVNLWILWISLAFLYYGNVLMEALIFSSDSTDDDDSTTTGYSFDYESLALTCSAEYVGTTLVILSVDSIGRIRSQAASYFFGGICVLVTALLYANDGNMGVLLVYAFGARMLLMSGSSTTWAGTAEILTTEIRSTGHAAANTLARLGGALAPYAVEDLGAITTGWIMMIVALLATVSVSQLPETAGRMMGVPVAKDDPELEIGPAGTREEMRPVPTTEGEMA